MAQLHIATVRGVPCGEALARALDTLQPVSRAWAHGADPTGASPLSAEVSVSVDLRQPGPQPLVTLRPPPGTWCGLELEVEPDDGTFTSLLVDARRDGAARRYLSTSTRRVRLDRLPLPLDQPGTHDITLFLDAGPTLASLEPSVNDARRDLLDTLLASMHWNAP
ncbi:MAG: hypothetical protein SFW67_36050 [Myxococcaceae bacterium]|nr:hypothetical protein [Myxococcaceae bacterium]